MTEKKDNSVKHAFWIHTKRKDDSSVTGYFTLPECTCSNCEFVVSFERERCPHCKAIMDQEHQ